MALPKLEGRITLAAAVSMTIVEDSGARNATVVVASAGDYYLTSTAAGGAGSLLATIAYELTTNGTLVGTYSVALDDTADSATGKITISATGVSNFAVTWVGTELRNLLGWTGDVTATAATYTAPEHAEYLFLPGCGRSSNLAPDGDVGVERTDGTLAVAPSGAAVALQYSTRYVDVLELAHLKGARTWVSLETTANMSLQKFWRDVIGTGKPFRYHIDRSVDATYVTWRTDEDGLRGFNPAPVVPGWYGASSIWSWRTNVLKLV